ncbi:uncharacterized protein LOC135378982 [Ornithodoros turicata]|uniref:uncharacterized protein LOC135378982 n=1 Tax=Ornithodoros turicata TaxID=34597 RepID=UPI003139D6F5
MATGTPPAPASPPTLAVPRSPPPQVPGQAPSPALANPAFHYAVSQTALPSSAPAPLHVAAVSLKLPSFWPAEPVVWFGQAEAQFALRGITNQLTKFYHVVAALSPTEATEVRDLVASPPAHTPYDTLKAELIRRTSMSEQRRYQRLLTQEELGDRTPSQLLRRMRQLLGDRPDALDDSLLRQLFLQRLPANVCMVLAAADNMSLNDLANLADRVLEMAPPQIAAVAPPRHSQLRPPHTDTTSSAQPVDLSVLADQIAALQLEVAALRRSSRSPQRSQSSHRRRSPSPAGMCWYHYRFRARVRKCVPLCTFSENDSASH